MGARRNDYCARHQHQRPTSCCCLKASSIYSRWCGLGGRFAREGTEDKPWNPLSWCPDRLTQLLTARHHSVTTATLDSMRVISRPNKDGVSKNARKGKDDGQPDEDARLTTHQGMERYHHGGRGLEVLIPGLIRDLEQRSDNSWDFLWGSVGPPVQMMSPDDVLQWMSDISIPSDVRDVQRKDMNHGKDIHGYVTQSVTDSEAIGKMMTLFRTARKPALRMLMNMRLRERIHSEAGKPKRDLLKTVNDVVSILTEMKKLGNGRYHGAHEFAKKFASDRGVDVLMQIIKTADDETSLAALWAMTLINDSAEERPYETSESEALSRYEKRKLIVKADGINTMVHVLANRPDDSRELALHLLKAIMTFPQHWLGFSGWAMSTYFDDFQLALLRGCITTILHVLDNSQSCKVKLGCIEVLSEFMASDDVDIDRHTSNQLEPSFFIPPKTRSRANTPSSASSQKSQRFAMLARLQGDQLLQEDDIFVDESSDSIARDSVLKNGGADCFVRLISTEPVRGRLKLSRLSARGLPKMDLLGESDPYLRIFLGDLENKTEIVMDTSRPVWSEEIEYEVEDVLQSCLYILCYDWNEHDMHKFMCMTRIHLAEIVGDAVENQNVVNLEHMLETELFFKNQRGEKAQPVRRGNQVLYDEWLPMRPRSGDATKIVGQLGSLHVHLELETDFRLDKEYLKVQASALGAVHLLYSHADTRHFCHPDKIAAPTVRLLLSCSDDAQANAAGVLCNMALDRVFVHAAVDHGATDALLLGVNYGSQATKRRCLEALSLFTLDLTVRDRMLEVSGHIGTTGNIIIPVVDCMLKEGVGEDILSAGLSVISNLATEAPKVQEMVIKSKAPQIMLDVLFRGRSDARAEAACLIALLVENPENRRHLSQLIGHSGDQTYTCCNALSRALCSQDTVTDARAKSGAYDTRSAASAALVYLARFGGLAELVSTMKHGDQDIKVEACSALAHVAADPNERDNVVAAGLVPDLVEMIVLANDTKSRLTASLVLARMSEGDEREKSEEIRLRVVKICEIVPAFGFGPIDPMVDICLQSIDDNQRAVAAQALSCWVMVPDYAEEIWRRGGDFVIDLCMIDRNLCPDGQWYALQLLSGCCEHPKMRERVATHEAMVNGRQLSTMKALRHVLRNSDRETVIETTLMLKQCWMYGGLEELVGSLMEDDGDLHALKAVATVLQPLCSKPDTRQKIAEMAGRHPDDIGVWMAKFMYAI